jgi:outer membrane protein assembly factor BamA
VLAPALAFAGRAAAACPVGLSSELIPLPIYSTLPNEGSTWGFMPVILRVCPEDRRTESIFAPSVSWNSVIHVTGTFRWFYYPSEDSSLTLMASASTRINYNNLLVWQRRPTAAGASTDELLVRIQRNVFERFFGFGPDTTESAESSYTSLRFIASARRGWNVAEHLNVGVTLVLERDAVESIGVPGLPLATEAFPQAPGMKGPSLLASQGLDFRYDNRRGGDYAEQGVLASAGGAFVEGLEGSPGFLRGGVEARVIWPQPWRVSGAARAYWSAVTTRQAPFYQQSSLGGSFLLRGFTERRFTDQQAWTVELEQRIRVVRTNIFGVVADWRVDPFVAVGQVFGGFADMFARPRVSVGAGFRVFAHPNIVGRIDVAYAGEGVKVYVEIGYPF